MAERLLQEAKDRDAKKKNKNPDMAQKQFLWNLTKTKEMKVMMKQNVKSADVCGAATRVKKVMFGYCVIYVILIPATNVFQRAQTLMRSFSVVPALIDPLGLLIPFVHFSFYFSC